MWIDRSRAGACGKMPRAINNGFRCVNVESESWENPARISHEVSTRFSGDPIRDLLRFKKSERIVAAPPHP